MKIALISFQLAGLIAVCASQSCTATNAVPIESLTGNSSSAGDIITSRAMRLLPRQVLVAKRADLVCSSNEACISSEDVLFCVDPRYTPLVPPVILWVFLHSAGALAYKNVHSTKDFHLADGTTGNLLTGAYTLPDGSTGNFESSTSPALTHSATAASGSATGAARPTSPLTTPSKPTTTNPVAAASTSLAANSGTTLVAGSSAAATSEATAAASQASSQASSQSSSQASSQASSKNALGATSQSSAKGASKTSSSSSSKNSSPAASNGALSAYGVCSYGAIIMALGLALVI